MPQLGVTRQNYAYIGWIKQSVWGTPLAPTSFWRWLDGTEANPEVKVTIEREGDTSPFQNLAVKASQVWKIIVKERVRPITAGCALQAVFGTGSDSVVPGTATTLSAAIAAGTNTFNSVASLGTAGTASVNFTPGYASQIYETQTVNLASRAGTGPYTYTLQGAATFTSAHLINDPVSLTSIHTFTRGLTTYDPYTLEFAFHQNSGGFAGKAFRIQDCVCAEVKITAEKGKALEIQHTWYGSFATIQAAFLTPSFEGTNVVGVAGGPLVFYHAANNWQLDNLTTGNATSVTKLDLTLKNTGGDLDLQNELLYPQYFLPGNMDISGTIDVHFQSYQQFLEMYYGSASATTGATDSNLVGYGQIQTSFASDDVNSLKIALPNAAYTAGKLTPKLDGKPLTQNIIFTALKNPANPNPVTITLSNSQIAVY